MNVSFLGGVWMRGMYAYIWVEESDVYSLRNFSFRGQLGIHHFPHQLV